jgi:hypothetical protein
MGAHTAPRTTTLGRVAGRGALTAAAALALTGGTASFAFAGEAHEGYKSDDSSCGCDDEKSWDDEHWDDEGDRDRKSDDDHHWKSDDDDCDDDGGRHHGKWDDDKGHEKDHKGHKKDREKDGDRFGARYEDSTHKGDDIYTINYVTRTGLLAGIL